SSVSVNWQSAPISRAWRSRSPHSTTDRGLSLPPLRGHQDFSPVERQRSGGVRPEAGRGRERSEPGFSAWGRFPPTPTSWGTDPGDFVPQPKVGGRGPHCWGSGVGDSVEPVDQAGRARGLVGGSDCPLPPASLRSAAVTFPLSPAAQGDKARVAASGFLPRGAAAERGSTAGGREGARAERAGFSAWGGFPRSPLRGGLIRGGFVPQPKVGGRDPTAGAVG